MAHGKALDRWAVESLKEPKGLDVTEAGERRPTVAGDHEVVEQLDTDQLARTGEPRGEQLVVA